jgi:hypothetical protein
VLEIYTSIIIGYEALHWRAQSPGTFLAQWYFCSKFCITVYASLFIGEWCDPNASLVAAALYIKALVGTERDGPNNTAYLLTMEGMVVSVEAAEACVELTIENCVDAFVDPMSESGVLSSASSAPLVHTPGIVRKAPKFPYLVRCIKFYGRQWLFNLGPYTGGPYHWTHLEILL